MGRGWAGSLSSLSPNPAQASLIEPSLAAQAELIFLPHGHTDQPIADLILLAFNYLSKWLFPIPGCEHLEA